MTPRAPQSKPVVDAEVGPIQKALELRVAELEAYIRVGPGPEVTAAVNAANAATGELRLLRAGVRRFTHLWHLRQISVEDVEALVALAGPRPATSTAGPSQPAPEGEAHD